MTETTYQRYRRENIEMRRILHCEVREFMLGTKDFQKRLAYLLNCIHVYRTKKGGSEIMTEGACWLCYENNCNPDNCKCDCHKEGDSDGIKTRDNR